MWTTEEQATNTDDYISTTAIFGEVKKYIISKNFKAATITNMFGTTTFDFSRADINGTAIIDISLLFGEVKLKVPANWHVVTDATNIFVAVDDKRKYTGGNVNVDKVLMLKGTGAFGSVKITNWS